MESPLSAIFPSAAATAASYSAKIAALRSHITTLGTWDFNFQKAVVDLALTLQELGRPWEATNWLMVGYSMQQHPDPRLEQTFRTIRNDLTGATPWQLSEQMVSPKMDLSSFPAVVWRQSAKQVSPRIRESSDGVLQFRNEALTRSLVHVFDIGKSDHQESGLMIYQSGAGGAGVIDFDLDGWPDTYLTVIDGAPNREDSRPNRLHRNLAGEFFDVTDNSSLIDRGFSQGISVGDYNADGWPDVYVANIGKNRLYRNNGDGTFREVTDQLLKQVTRGRWQVMPADQLGDYFAKDRLARAVATRDANRDGLSDLIVTHLFDPVGLLINRSETSAKQTRFFLRARSTHRDAIGARIRFTCEDRTLEQPLLRWKRIPMCQRSVHRFRSLGRRRAQRRPSDLARRWQRIAGQSAGRR